VPRFRRGEIKASSEITVDTAKRFKTIIANDAIYDGDYALAA
jgi:hypothetical protein